MRLGNQSPDHLAFPMSSCQATGSQETPWTDPLREDDWHTPLSAVQQTREEAREARETGNGDEHAARGRT